MSAKGRGPAMRKGGHYATPAWGVRALLKRLGPLGPATVLDAGCGAGAIMLELLRADPALRVIGVEKDSRLARRCGVALARAGHEVSRYHVVRDDFLSSPIEWPDRKSQCGPADLAIFNPPFELTLEFVQRASAYVARIGAFGKGSGGLVCCLGRLNWLGGGASPKALPGTIARHEWLEEHPPEVLVLPRRPSFGVSAKGSTTDAAEYCWFLWGQAARPNRWSFADVATCRDLSRKRRGGGRAIRS